MKRLLTILIVLLSFQFTEAQFYGSGGTAFPVQSSGIDSGEIIGNYLYLFSSTDTVIVDVSTLAGGDSIWSTSTGKIENGDTTLSFRHSFGDWSLVNDSLDLFGVETIPYSGSVLSLPNGKGINGIADFSGIGSSNLITAAFFDTTFALRGFSYDIDANAASIETGDFLVNASDTATIFGHPTIIYGDGSTSLEVNGNGVVVPKHSSDPPGEAGAIYFNTTSSTFRKHNGTSWSDW